MANNPQHTWLFRATKRMLVRVSPGDMLRQFGAPFDGTPTSNAQAIYDPNLSAVSGQPSKYWIITGDAVSLMDAAARAAVDAAELVASRDAVAAQLDQQEDVLRAFMLVVLDQFNTLRDLHGLPNATPAQLKSAIRNKLGT